jgi:hypothetical protein
MEVKKRQMVEKMLQLMREDPTLFNHAIEEVKSVSVPCVSHFRKYPLCRPFI